MDDQLQALIGGRLKNPFRALGPQRTADGERWRVRLPAAADAALRASSGKLMPMQMREKGIFEWHGTHDLLPDHPLVVWTDEQGRRHQHVDPYSFRAKLGRKKLARFTGGTAFDSHRLLGAHLRNMDGIEGVRFAVWAPNAAQVSVVGDFNGWNGAAHPMRSIDSGVWALFIPGVVPGALYKFELSDGERSWLKADPYAFRAEHRPQTASVITAPSAYLWGDEAWLARRAETDWLHAPMTVYEVHPGSWRPSSAPGYRSLARDLVNYVKDRGFTHIELLPIAEHPLDDSWGYQTTGYFAPTSRYGNPDDLRYLVDCAHQQGIGVILDWTPAHFPKDAHGLALFDGTYLYEHADPKQREHPDWNTLVFDYARYEVRSFLFSNAAYWLNEFHFDGLRVDAVSSMLYLDYSRKPGQWTPNEFGGNENLGAMTFLRDLNVRLHRDFPGAVVIAEESTAWPLVSRPTYVGGLGFSMKWNLGWMHDTLGYLGNDPIHRKYNHDALTFTAQYAFTENFLLPLSHDEVVHGKGSLLAKMPGDPWQQLANLRLLLCHQYTMPGKKLLFMGGELAARQEWDFRGELAWELLDDPAHAGIQRLVDDLNTLVRSLPALHALDFDSDGFEWLDCHDSNQSVIAFVRKASRHPGQQHVVCVLNFTPVPRPGYRLGVPAAGTYVERLNSDSSHYGGSNAGNDGARPTESVPWMGWPQSVTLTLPPLGALILAPASQLDR